MKTTQQKKKTVKNKLDRIVQQVYRKPDDKCLACGDPAEVLHHFIQKSQSLYLRWRPRNLVPLCSKCHCRHHISGDPNIVNQIIMNKGLKWFDWIQCHRNIKADTSLTYLKELLDAFKTIKEAL